MIALDPGFIETLTQLRSEHPDTPFLALGQTIWWDEPMKAVLRCALDASGLGGRMVLGVHDTDYFAKLPRRRPDGHRYELLPHNDGSTRDLWSAAGEISTLFGSETFPTRQDFIRRGVPLGRVTNYVGDKSGEFIDQMTEAWGWRGLVYSGSTDRIVHSLPLDEMESGIRRMLDYGFEGTVASVVDGCCRDRAQELASSFIAEKTRLREAGCNRLTDLYQQMLPMMYEMMMGRKPDNIEVTCTADLLRFSPATCQLPRFQLLDLFLIASTRTAAARAYDAAVTGSEMYTLDRFGLGTLPFDVVAPSIGRGTLRVTLRAVHIESKNPVRIPLNRPIRGVEDLARILEEQLGSDVVIVGKAVALLSMLSAEFMMVFHEEASMYVSRTRTMNRLLRESGWGVKLNPLLRLNYRTWDALEAGCTHIHLPEHLSEGFGASVVSCMEFGRRWQYVVAEADRTLEKLAEPRGAKNLLEVLCLFDPMKWPDLMTRLAIARNRLTEIAASAASLRSRVRDLYSQLQSIRIEVNHHEKERSRLLHAGALEEREHHGLEIQSLLIRRKDTLRQIRLLKQKAFKIERSEEAIAIRSELLSLESEAEIERMKLIRNAILTRDGLKHSAHRPTAWWIPMVDSSGAWFRRIVETTTGRIEAM